MLRLINNKKIYFYIFSLIFLTTIINTNLLNFINNKFFIKKIEINSIDHDITDEVLIKLNHLLNKNIFTINKTLVLKELNNLNYIENLNIKKKYPSILEVNVNKTEILAITYINQKKFFLGKNGKLISFKDLKVPNPLPIIFGNFSVKDYFLIKKKLEIYDIDISKITKYYFHKNKRWDIYFNDNIVIKLPNKDISDALKLYKKFLNSNKIKPNAIIDLRVNNRLVLTNG